GRRGGARRGGPARRRRDRPRAARPRRRFPRRRCLGWRRQRDLKEEHSMHLVWVNELAHEKGGAERYVADTAARLRERGVRSTLLYDVKSPVDPAYLAAFDGAYPQVDRRAQLRELVPDIVYVHRIDEGGAITELMSSSAKVVRFFHDYNLFCLREPKYTPVGLRTCAAPAGLRCYPCLGFVQRKSSFPHMKF